jgi:proteic killer suppression protein
MVLQSFRHKGLKRLYEDDDGSGLPSQSIRKIKAILAALEFGDRLSEVATIPGWQLHALKGSRKGEFSITVTRNWRITFRAVRNVITNINFEDYH